MMNDQLRHAMTRTGLRIAYRRVGAGPTLLLLHGFICDSRVWRRQIDDLRDEFDVVAWDAPGCGESDDPPEEFTMAQFADCLFDLMDEAKISSAHLLGLSWGGTLALEFHHRFATRARSLIVADSYAGWTGSLGADAAQARLARCLRESALPTADWVPTWVLEAFSSGAPADLHDEYAAIMSDLHPVGFRAMSRAVTPDFSNTLSRVSVPTLLIWGCRGFALAGELWRSDAGAHSRVPARRDSRRRARLEHGAAGPVQQRSTVFLARRGVRGHGRGSRARPLTRRRRDRG